MTKKRNFVVTISDGDRSQMRVSWLGLTPDMIDDFAVTRAAGRKAFMATKSVSKTLSAMVSGLPQVTVRAWMADYLKQTKTKKAA